MLDSDYTNGQHIIRMRDKGTESDQLQKWEITG